MYNTTSNTSAVQQASFDYTTLNQKTETTTSSVDAQQDRFLKLLVAQLQSQDPLNPMDNAATTSQMAQMSTVTGIEKLNATMSQMMLAFSSMQGMQASGLIGRQVLTTNSATQFDGSNPVQFKIDMPNGADKLAIAITDAKGQLVDKFELPSQTPGTKGFTWDGVLADGSTAPAGTYHMLAQGETSGKQIAYDVMTWQKATSIELGSGSTKVLLADGSKVDFSKITQIQ